MKSHTFIALAFLLTASLAKPAIGAETLLVCEGRRSSSVLTKFNGPERRTFLIQKDGSEVTSVKTDTDVFTLTRTDVQTASNKGPLYRVLLVEPGRLILRYEITEDKRNSDTTILDTGRYTFQSIGYTAEGQCTVSQKMF